MKTKFKRIAITGRFQRISTVDTLKILIALLEEQNVKLIIEEKTAKYLENSQWPTAARNELAKHADLVIVVGGDGSLLYSAHCASDYGVPILGINRGRLGFLTDIYPDELQTKICEILAGDYKIEERFLLQAKITGGQAKEQHDALNDVVLYAGSLARMIEFEVYINEQFVYSLRSDGLIIATPTGSTAYALSAGGPILHPSMHATVLTPLAPHTLTSRPIVVSNEDKIELIISPSSDARPKFSCDGQKLMSLDPGDKLEITRKKQPLKLVHPIDYDYYHVLRTKLRWGSQLENKITEG